MKDQGDEPLASIPESKLSESEVQTLQSEIEKFHDWLQAKGMTKDNFPLDPPDLQPFPNQDWIMKVDKGTGKVSFNTDIRGSCESEYFKMVLLHEYFHLVVQKVPNKKEATKIKDDFGPELMKLIDIEADFYVALYLKEGCNYDIDRYWKTYYAGSMIFADEWVRSSKLERFIGSMLSISKMFLTYPKEPEELAYDLYLPTIGAIYTESSMYILVVKKEHIYFEEIKIEYDDLKELKEQYQHSTKFTMTEYVERIKRISKKALALG